MHIRLGKLSINNNRCDKLSLKVHPVFIQTNLFVPCRGECQSHHLVGRLVVHIRKHLIEIERCIGFVYSIPTPFVVASAQLNDVLCKRFLHGQFLSFSAVEIKRIARFLVYVCELATANAVFLVVLDCPKRSIQRSLFLFYSLQINLTCLEVSFLYKHQWIPLHVPLLFERLKNLQLIEFVSLNVIHVLRPRFSVDFV